MPIPNDLSKLSNVVKNDVVKKAEYNKLVIKVNNIDTSDFVLKTKYSTGKTELENKIPNTSGLVKKTDYNAKTTEIENKIPDISNLIKKNDYNTKITNIENNGRQLQAYDLSFFKGKQYFDEGSGNQNYLVFLPMRKCFKLNSIVNLLIVFCHGNLKEYLMKVLNHVHHLIIVLIQD